MPNYDVAPPVLSPPQRVFHDGCHTLRGGLTGWYERNSPWFLVNDKKHTQLKGILIVYRGKHEKEWDEDQMALPTLVHNATSYKHKGNTNLLVSFAEKSKCLSSFVHKNTVQKTRLHRTDLDGLFSPAHDLSRAYVSWNHSCANINNVELVTMAGLQRYVIRINTFSRVRIIKLAETWPTGESSLADISMSSNAKHWNSNALYYKTRNPGGL